MLNSEGVEIPTLGRVVLYRSRTGLYTVPAIVTATQLSLHWPNVEKGLIPELTSELHVHLAVLSPGPPGKRADATDFVTEESPHGRAENSGIGYPEWDIPYDYCTPKPSGYHFQNAGTWAYPGRE